MDGLIYAGEYTKGGIPGRFFKDLEYNNIWMSDEDIKSKIKEKFGEPRRNLT